jgi:hypothetical protein
MKVGEAHLRDNGGSIETRESRAKERKIGQLMSKEST